LYHWWMLHVSGVHAKYNICLWVVESSSLKFWMSGGVDPAHVSELSQPDGGVLASRVAYQLGNLASSASSTTEIKLAVGMA
jgi:hypothetical protein